MVSANRGKLCSVMPRNSKLIERSSFLAALIWSRALYFYISNEPFRFGIDLKLANEIRRFVADNYFEPARSHGETEVVVVSGEVHSGMGLKQRLPAVCSVLRGSELQDAFGASLIREVRMPTVEKDSSTNRFVFKIE